MTDDKQQHFHAGIILCLLLGVIFTPAKAALIVIIIGALKELVWNWLFEFGTPDYFNFIMVAIGAEVGIVILAGFVVL